MDIALSEQLHQAAEKNDSKELENIINNNSEDVIAIVNAKHAGRPILSWAAMRGQIDAVR